MYCGGRSIGEQTGACRSSRFFWERALLINTRVNNAVLFLSYDASIHNVAIDESCYLTVWEDPLTITPTVGHALFDELPAWPICRASVNPRGPDASVARTDLTVVQRQEDAAKAQVGAR
jgi:hypothetical protein